MLGDYYHINLFKQTFIDPSNNDHETGYSTYLFNHIYPCGNELCIIHRMHENPFKSFMDFYPGYFSIIAKYRLSS